MAASLVPAVPAQDSRPIDLPWWSWSILVVALFGAYVMLQENGALTSHWMVIHEFFHDSRHALGLPCH